MGSSCTNHYFRRIVSVGSVLRPMSWYQFERDTPWGKEQSTMDGMYRFYSKNTSDTGDDHRGPLSGYKVLDLGQVVAGNFCGALLAYFGAEVIKVEPPQRGDALRHLRSMDQTNKTSLWWRSYGRNRKCITIDLKTEQGRKLVRSLAERVDVLIENFRPGVMESWGLGPEDLPKDLVYTRISGYGQTGPKASLPGYASVCEAYGGFRFINGYPDRPSVRPNISLGDSLAGLHAAFGAVMALLHRDGLKNRPGASGQVVDASISECMYNMLEGCLTEYFASGSVRGPSGSTLTGVVPSGTWRSKDNVYIIIGGNGNSVYDRLMVAIGRPDMTTANEKYATDSKRCEVQEEICDEIEKFVSENTAEYVMKVMNEARVPSGPILSIEDIVHEEQYQVRGMFESVKTPEDDANGVHCTIPAMLPVLSKTRGRTLWAGPALGHHTDEILKTELEMGDAEIESLRTSGVI